MKANQYYNEVLDQIRYQFQIFQNLIFRFLTK
jgi:hypothetical protein